MMTRVIPFDESKTTEPIVWKDEPLIDDSIKQECRLCKIIKPVYEFHKQLNSFAKRCKKCVHDRAKQTKPRRYFSTTEYKKPYVLTPDEAWVWGFFMADGSAGRYDTKYGVKYQWYICKLDRDLLEKAKAIIEKVELSLPSSLSASCIS